MTNELTRLESSGAGIVAAIADAAGRAQPVMLRLLKSRDEIAGWRRLSGPNDYAEAMRRRGLFPEASLHEWRDLLDEAIAIPATVDEAEQIISVMLEMFPDSRFMKPASVMVFMDGMVRQLLAGDGEEPGDFKGYSSAVLFTMAERLVKTRPTIPTIKDALDCAATARCDYRTARDALDRVWDFNCNWQKCIAEADVAAGRLHPDDALPF